MNIKSYEYTKMLILFKFSSYSAVIALFLVGFITLSDIFINKNQLTFYLLTLFVALIFFLMSFLGIVIYKNFRGIYNHIMMDKKVSSAQGSLRNLILIASFVAIIIALISSLLSFALIQRMRDGMSLLG